MINSVILQYVQHLGQYLLLTMVKRISAVKFGS